MGPGPIEVAAVSAGDGGASAATAAASTDDKSFAGGESAGGARSGAGAGPLASFSTGSGPWASTLAALFACEQPSSNPIAPIASLVIGRNIRVVTLLQRS